jgi:hypothetical protein
VKYLLPILFACVPLFRLETRPDMAREVGAYCEAEWEHGDLNADGIVNMEDFAIYAGLN